MLAAARTGHLGPTVFRSTDGGRSVGRSGKAAGVRRSGSGRVVDHTFWLTPGHPSQPGAWYAGTSPQGLFRSDDGGATWAGVAGFNDHPQRKAWCGGDQDGTPDGAKLHSILVDPRDPRHLYIGMSSGGVFESVDGGADWRRSTAACAPTSCREPTPEFGHDPHCVRFARGQPDRLYQQNHCGIYRLDRPSRTWTRHRRQHAEVGRRRSAFRMVTHPRDPDTLWVFPMDGTDVWPRTRARAGARPCTARVNGGASWQRQDEGLPPAQAWWTVKRQAMTADAQSTVGLYFGTTSGEVWGEPGRGPDAGGASRGTCRHI